MANQGKGMKMDNDCYKLGYEAGYHKREMRDMSEFGAEAVKEYEKGYGQGWTDSMKEKTNSGPAN